MEAKLEAKRLERWIRLLLLGFIIGLVLSGVTAFPLPQEVRALEEAIRANSENSSAMLDWIRRVRVGLDVAEAKYPLLLYGTDWLAFAHLVIATAFVGPYRDPVRNIWIVQWGMISCAAVIPLALVCGPLRGIPLFWQFIDCSFGVVGIVPLFICYRMIRRLERLRVEAS